MATIILTATQVGMSDDLKGAIITALVAAIVSIIGFIVTNVSMSKSFKNELARQRDNTALEKMAAVPYETLAFWDLTIKAGKIEKNLEKYENIKLTNYQLRQKEKDEAESARVSEELTEKMNYLYNTIYAYGSPTAIKIVSKMQSTNYILAQGTTEEKKWAVLAYMILLVTQVKKDVTTVTVNPQYWLQMRITDYTTRNKDIDKAINNAVDELKLDKDFKIR